MITPDPAGPDGTGGLPKSVGTFGGGWVEGDEPTAAESGPQPVEAWSDGMSSTAAEGSPDGRASARRPGRMLGSSPWGDGYDALIWLVLIGLLGLYGWYAASLQPPVEEPAVVAFSALDTAMQGVDAEQADLERQLAEAKGRIAALEEAVSQQRQPTAAPQPSLALSEEPLPSAPSRASQVAELGGRQTGQGLLLELAHSDLSFPIGQSTLPPGDHAILDRVADLLLQHPTVAARVEGHTDSAGRDEVNLTLSQERAEVVKEALVRRGVGEVRILAVGHGETRPIDDNTSQAGRDRNRRIEIYFTEPPG